MTVTGTVYTLIYEADGDIHIRLTPDSQFVSLMNADNYSGEDGKLVLEPICATTITQSDAVQPCSGLVNKVYIPSVGEYVSVTGSYVTDNDHGWNEIHPVTSITIIPAAVSNIPKVPFTGVTAYPNPTKDMITFKLNEQPASPVYIIIQDALGRSAGQYQMLYSNKLNVTTTYLPAGNYFYNVMQDDKHIQTGKFVVIH